MKSRIKYWFLAVCLGVLPLVALALLPRPTAAAGLWYVAPGGSDANNCQTAGTACQTINGAIGKAATGDTINVQVGTYTAPAGDQVVFISRSVALLGGWDGSFSTQSGLSTVDGQGARRGLVVSDTASVLAERFVFRNGLVTNGIGGAGINNMGVLTLAHSRVTGNSSGTAINSQGGGVENSGTLTVTESTIDNNTARDGAGLHNAIAAQARIVSSTISGNHAGDACCSGFGGGGGIFNVGNMVLLDSSVSGNDLRGDYSGAGILDAGILTVTNSTISANHGGSGAGIYAVVSNAALYNVTIGGNSGNGLTLEDGQATMRNSVLSGNGGNDCFHDAGYAGVVTSGGYNLITRSVGCGLVSSDIAGADGLLAPIADNGGPTPTQALLAGSRAFDEGNPGGCFGPDGLLATDQRGFARVGRCDIGAFEVQTLDFSAKSANRLTSLPGQPIGFAVLVDNSSNAIASVTMTDAVPNGLTFIANSLTASSGSAVQVGGVITWTGLVSADTSVAIQYSAASLPNASLGTVFTNTAVITGSGHEVIRQTAVTLALPQLFLPLIAKPLAGIQGYVTLNGTPVQFVTLELRRYNGQTFSTQQTTSTDGRGFYNFASAPSLAPGEAYYVRYLNQFQTNRLSFWGTADITSYTAGGSVAAGNFDIADVVLQSPAPGSAVALPALFKWTPRPATPSDSYQLVLAGPNGLMAQSAPQGYVDGVTVASLPSEFQSGVDYVWYVNVYSPDVGFGTAYYVRPVSFTNAQTGSQQSVNGGAALEAATPRADSGRP